MAWPWQKKATAAHAQRSQEWGSSAIPLPGMSPGGGLYAFTGRYVTPEVASGLAAVGAAVRLIAETIGSLPLITYRGAGTERVRALRDWQYQLLHERPNLEQSAMEFWADVASCIEYTGNAFIQLNRAGSRVVEMHVVDPYGVRVHRDKDTQEKRFDVTVDGHLYQSLTSAEMLHIRGFAIRGGMMGVSPIAEHKNTLGVALAAEEFAGRSYANDATPGLAITVPGNLGRQQATEMLQVWNSTHQGLHNAARPAVLTNGATLERLGMTLADAELIRSRQYGVEEVARIFRIPPAMLGVPNAGTNQSAEEESLRFVRYCLLPRCRRIEMALRACDALFPQGTDLEPEWLVDGLLRADTQTRYDALLKARQGGWMSMNEARAIENLPPVEGGDEVQQTPVGGAPNLQPTVQNDKADSA